MPTISKRHTTSDATNILYATGYIILLFTRVGASHVAPTTCHRYSTSVDILRATLYTDLVAFGEVVRGR